MTAPEFVKLRTDLADGTLVDFLSGFSISGHQVVPYPTDPAQQKAVDNRLRFGILFPATYEEWLTQNPIPLHVPEEIILTEPIRVTPVRYPEFEGEGNTVWISQLTPRTTAAFVMGEIDADDSSPTLVLIVDDLSKVGFYNVIFSGVHNVSSPNVIVLTDGIASYAMPFDENVVISGADLSEGLTPEQYDQGFTINLLRDDEGWTANFDLAAPTPVERFIAPTSGDTWHGESDGTDGTISALAFRHGIVFGDGQDFDLTFTGLNNYESAITRLSLYNGWGSLTGGTAAVSINGTPIGGRQTDIPIGAAREFYISVRRDGSGVYSHTTDHGRTIPNSDPDY